VAMTFFCVSGGSYGLEDAVRAGYPLLSIVGLLIIPWIWSIPTALLTAELSTAMPENGGYVIWTKRAFGPLLGFQSAYWGWVSSLADNALYQVMFVDYLSRVTSELSFTAKILISLGVVFVICFINIVGVQIVGRLSVIFTVLVISPFLILSIWGMPQLDQSALTKTPPSFEQADWGLFLSVILWNTLGWNNVGSVAGEIKEPHKTYPRGLIIAVVLVILSYVWPLMVAVSLERNYDQWYVGYYSDIAGSLSEGLKYYTSTIGLVSALGLFNVRLCTASAALSALSPDVHFPLLGKIHHKFKTPWVSILINSIGIALLIVFPFQMLVEIDVTFYALSLIVQFGALFWLRIKEPNLNRPYKLPLGTIGVGIFVGPPIVLCILLVILTSNITKLVMLGVLVIGAGLYGLIYWKNKSLGLGFRQLNVQQEEEEEEEEEQQSFESLNNLDEEEFKENNLHENN